MIKVLFVCHGNICRSPMAEFVFKNMVKKKGLSDKFIIASAATSTEEIGNPVHPETRKILSTYGISTEGKRAIQMTRADYKEYDYIVAMDQRNVINMGRIIGQDSMNKVKRLLDFTSMSGDIADPWYTGDFDLTYQDVYRGCEELLETICKKYHI
ncbi:MAG: low molecular weight protein-tyrosine-phosphatase [Herbinix sp.]|jgi:protein-tyrosine phosphatase|nr:low molecular weight protein-tyrosine-phosphatase [Herbinix sp.]